MNKQELLEAIALADEARSVLKTRIAALKREVDESESDLIEVTLRKERLVEALRVHSETSAAYEPDYRDREIAAFKAAFPELSKKIDEETASKT